MVDCKIKLATVFSGIGAVEYSFKKMQIDSEIIFACDCGERMLPYSIGEIYNLFKVSKESDINTFVKKLYESTKKENFVKKTYFKNYEIDESRWYDDIRFVDGKKYKDEVDLFVGGSPCQSFSLIGKRGGLDDARGTLFFEYARLVKEMQPKAFIYENVPGMLIHDKGNTWKVIKNVFESLGYKIYYSILNSCDYGIPQSRKRLFVVGFKNQMVNFTYPKKKILEKTMFDFLEKKVEAKRYLGEKGFKFVTNPKYYGRARINQTIIRTQKANQQFNWNGDFVFEELNYKKHSQEILNRAYVGFWNNKKGLIRQLSPRECFRLMGYDDDFQIIVPDVKAYRQAGNSIVVNVMCEILKEIIKTGIYEKN